MFIFKYHGFYHYLTCPRSRLRAGKNIVLVRGNLSILWHIEVGNVDFVKENGVYERDESVLQYVFISYQILFNYELKYLVS